MTYQHLESFRNLVLPWCDCYRQATRTWIAVSSSEGWRLRYARIHLDPEVTTDVMPEFTVKTAHIWAGVQIDALDKEGALAVLDDARDAPLLFKAHNERFDLGAGLQKSANYLFYPLGHSLLAAAHREPVLQISCAQSGDVSPPDRATLEVELYSADPPINGIADLLSRVRAPDEVLQGMRLPSLDIVAVAPARLGEDCSLRDGVTRIQVCAAPGLNRDLFELGLVCIEKSGPPRSMRIDRATLAWPEGGDSLGGLAEVPRITAPTVVAFLRYNGHYIDRLTLADRGRSLNDLHELHRLIDRDDHLKVLLSSANADQFEQGVALLFGNLGLAVLHYGSISEFGNGPDMYVVSKSGDFYVVECTTGHPDRRGKLQKLYKRAADVRDFWQRRGLTFSTVQAVLVTAMPRANTSEVATEAIDLGVSLICREDIDRLHASLSTARQPSAEEFRREVLAHIPRQESSDLFLPPFR